MSGEVEFSEFLVERLNAPDAEDRAKIISKYNGKRIVVSIFGTKKDAMKVKDHASKIG